MAGILEVKMSYFFDKEFVTDRLARGERNALQKIGYRDRRAMKGIIREPGKKGLPSKPGKAPKNRTGLLKNRIFFAAIGLDSEPGVVTGPELVGRSRRKAGVGVKSNKTDPQLINEGGRATITYFEKESTGQRDKYGRYREARLVRKQAVVNYAPRPYRDIIYKKYEDKRILDFKGIMK